MICSHRERAGCYPSNTTHQAQSSCFVGLFRQTKRLAITPTAPHKKVKIAASLVCLHGQKGWLLHQQHHTTRSEELLCWFVHTEKRLAATPAAPHNKVRRAALLVCSHGIKGWLLPQQHHTTSSEELLQKSHWKYHFVIIRFTVQLSIIVKKA